MKIKTKLVLIISGMLLICVMFGCTGRNEGTEPIKVISQLINQDQPYVLLSPNGSYEAILEEVDDNGVKSYRLYIANVNSDTGSKYTADLIFRARDTNYVLWADEEDILWAYSGDAGTFFWINENGSWMKNAYYDDKSAKVPQALKDARLNKYD